MSADRLSLGKAGFVMLGLGTVAVMGLPGVGDGLAQRGGIHGLAIGADGTPLVESPVALFDAHGSSIIELVHTDRAGRFAFHESPERFHLLAHGGARLDLVPAWGIDLGREDSPLRLELGVGESLRVRAVGDAGEPIPGAEVRVYDPLQGTSVVARESTDLDGEATVLVPERFHLAVLPGDGTRLPAWRFDQRAESEASSIEMKLPAAVAYSGTLLDERGSALRNVLVSAWDERDGWHWNGFRKTSARGFWALPGRPSSTEFHVVDVDGRFVPILRRAPASSETPLSWTLTASLSREIRCEGSNARGIQARVWLYSHDTGAWSWSHTTDSSGSLAAPVSNRHGAMVEPLDPAAPPLSSFEQVYSASPLRVRAPSER